MQIDRKHICVWNQRHLQKNGFHIIEKGPQASVAYPDHVLRLALKANPLSNASTVARISEVDASLPVRDRVKCWQPHDQHAVTMHVLLRFKNADPPPNLTEVAFFWNAPFPTQPEDTPILPTVIGASRDHGMYTAVIVQNFDGSDGLFQRRPMPEWLNVSAWHAIDIILTTTLASISVRQSGRCTNMLSVPWLQPPGPLAAEISIDNDNFPEGHLPVLVPDWMEVQRLDIRWERI